MKPLLKIILPMMLLGSVETAFFLYLHESMTFRLDSFFFGWGVIWLIFLSFSVKGTGPSGVLRGIGSSGNTDVMNYSTLAGASAESSFSGKKKYQIHPFMTSINFIYLLLLICNVIGYILTQ